MGRKWVLLLVAFWSTSILSAQPANDLRVTGAWARATASEAMADSDNDMMGGDMGVSAVYLTIENGGEQAIRLVGAATPVAGMVEIHQSSMEGDVMRMRPVEGGIEIPAGAAVALEPGGFHVMLMMLNTALVPGDAISLTLTFAPSDAPDDTFDLVLGAPILTEPPEAAGDILTLDVWARPTAPAHGMSEATSEMLRGEGVSAVYMRLLNRGDEADRLIAAAADVAGLVELHESRMEGDVMQMRSVEGGIEIPAGETVTLQPGGLHVMLMDLQQELVPGSAFLLALEFESGAEMTVAVPVYDAMGMME